MIYYLYDIENNNIYLSQSTNPYDNSTTIAPPSIDREDYSFDTTKQVWSKNSTFLATKKANDLTTRINELLLRRYETKYLVAKRFIATGDTADSDTLSLEAGFNNLLDTLNIKIDAVRVRIKNILLVDKDLTKAKTILIKFEALPYTATNADIVAIFS